MLTSEILLSLGINSDFSVAPRASAIVPKRDALSYTWRIRRTSEVGSSRVPRVFALITLPRCFSSGCCAFDRSQLARDIFMLKPLLESIVQVLKKSLWILTAQLTSSTHCFFISCPFFLSWSREPNMSLEILYQDKEAPSGQALRGLIWALLGKSSSSLLNLAFRFCNSTMTNV